MNSAIRITISILFTTLLSNTTTAAPMLRVVDVKDCRTLVVDRVGVAASVRLAQIVVSPDDEAAATEYLRSTLVSSWVLVETDARGESYVYRSPDGLFVNAELARRAWTSGHTEMVYLGEAAPGPRHSGSSVAPKAKPASIPPPAKPHRARTQPRGASRIPRLPSLGK